MSDDEYTRKLEHAIQSIRIKLQELQLASNDNVMWYEGRRQLEELIRICDEAASAKGPLDWNQAGRGEDD